MEMGSTGSAALTVTTDDTAISMRSGDVNVVATPRLVALAEEATVKIVTLDDDTTTSVGTRVEIDHLHPSPVGAQIVATARLEDITGRDLHFTVEIEDGGVLVARALVTRVIVDRSRFDGVREPLRDG